MKFQQVLILLAMAALAMVVVGAEEQCSGTKNVYECDKCCSELKFWTGDYIDGNCVCKNYKPHKSERYFQRRGHKIGEF